MTQTVGSISKQLDTSISLSKAASWDPVGLQFGDPEAAVSRVAVCHEVTPLVVDTLIAADVDLVISYHPLLFRPTTRLVAGDSANGRAFRLIAGGIALATVHTAFDVVRGGTADSLADALGLSDIEGFGPAWGSEIAKIITFAPEEAADHIAAAMAAEGAGKIGSYSSCSYRSTGVGTFFVGAEGRPAVGVAGTMNSETETRIEMVAPLSRVDAVVAALAASHPYEEPGYDVIATRSNAGFIGRQGRLGAPVSTDELAAMVGERLGGIVRHAGSGAVETVAVIPGSGGSFLGSVTADAVVTGDVSHHQARDLQSRGVSVVDPGHAATERPGVKALYAAVAQMIGNTIDMTDVDPDPWKERY